jgi:hypothetical protein
VAALSASIAESMAVAGHTITVTASIGVAAVQSCVPVDEMLRRADQAMYRAKAGGGGYAAWEPDGGRAGWKPDGGRASRKPDGGRASRKPVGGRASRKPDGGYESPVGSPAARIVELALFPGDRAVG